MTSLYPGTLFCTPGLNRRSTPTSAGTTSEELEKRYRRLPYNGRPWPAPSPVAGVYDIRNSSTQLIMMNNKARKRSKLRGHNDPDQESDRIPNPDRHSRTSTPVNKEFHTKCTKSQSPRYTPSVCSELEWNNSPAKFYDGSAVNPKRHTSCRVPSDPTAFQIGMVTESPRRSSSRLSLPARFQSSPLLTHPELKPGERAYLTHIARIYSAGQMMKLKQAQYNQLLFKEMEKGLYGRDEVERYGRFINMGKDRQYQMLRPTTGFRRVMSAPPQNYQVYDNTSYHSNNNEDSFSTAKSSDSKNNSNNGKETNNGRETKRAKTVVQRSTRERQLSPRSMRTQQVYKATQEIPPVRSNKTSANKPVKANRSQPAEKQGTKKTEVSPPTSSTESSSDNNAQAEGQSVNREGVNRPKSRLGHASVKNADEQKKSDSESSGKDNTTETSTTYQKAPPSSPKDEPSQSNGISSSENKPLSPVMENQTSSEQNESSDSSNARRDDNNSSSDDSQHQQRSSEESKGQEMSSDDSGGQQRSSDDNRDQQSSSDDSRGQQRSSDESESQQKPSSSEGQQRSPDDSRGQQRSSDESESQQKSLTDEEKSQLKSVNEESTGQDTSVTEDYSRDDDHNTRSDYTTTEETQPTKSTTENTYTSQTTQDKSDGYTSSATQGVSPRDNTESTNDDTYTMTYDSSAANHPTENTASESRNFSMEKSSSAEEKTTTNYTDDSKGHQPRRDSLEVDNGDNPRRVNKDIDTIEY